MNLRCFGWEVGLKKKKLGESRPDRGLGYVLGGSYLYSDLVGLSAGVLTESIHQLLKGTSPSLPPPSPPSSSRPPLSRFGGVPIWRQTRINSAGMAVPRICLRTRFRRTRFKHPPHLGGSQKPNFQILSQAWSTPKLTCPKDPGVQGHPKP